MNVKRNLKRYSKTNPIIFYDFNEIIEWGKNRKENNNSWKISVDKLKNYRLDVPNPNSNYQTEISSPSEIIEKILKNQVKNSQLLNEMKLLIDGEKIDEKK